MTLPMDGLSNQQQMGRKSSKWYIHHSEIRLWCQHPKYVVNFQCPALLVVVMACKQQRLGTKL